MAILRTCCCYDNVWKGSFACAIYTLILYIFTVAADISTIVDIEGHLSGTKPMTEGPRFELGITTRGHMVFCAINATISMGVAIASVVLLIGLHKNKRKYLLPWMLGIIVDLIFGLIQTIYLISSSNSKVKDMLGALVLLYFATVLLNIYCLLCVISQYQVYEEQVQENMNVCYEPYSHQRVIKTY